MMTCLCDCMYKSLCVYIYVLLFIIMIYKRPRLQSHNMPSDNFGRGHVAKTRQVN